MATRNFTIDPRILAAVKMLEISFNNSRAYSDTVETEEQRIEQLKRIQDALDKAQYREALAHERCYAAPRVLK